MTRLVLAATLAASVLGMAVLHAPTTASAQGDPTCSALLGIQVHGQHIIGDYVTGLGGISGEMPWPPTGGIVGEAVSSNDSLPLHGGPGPAFHFPNGFAPGASFCLGHEEPPHSPNAEHPPS